MQFQLGFAEQGKGRAKCYEASTLQQPYVIKKPQAKSTINFMRLVLKISSNGWRHTQASGDFVKRNDFHFKV